MGKEALASSGDISRGPKATGQLIPGRDWHAEEPLKWVFASVGSSREDGGGGWGSGPVDS